MLLGMSRNYMNGFGLSPGEQGPQDWPGPGPAPSYFPDAAGTYKPSTEFFSEFIAKVNTGRQSTQGSSIRRSDSGLLPDLTAWGLQQSMIPGVVNWQLYAGIGVLVVGFWLFKKR